MMNRHLLADDRNLQPHTLLPRRRRFTTRGAQAELRKALELALPCKLCRPTDSCAYQSHPKPSTVWHGPNL